MQFKFIEPFFGELPRSCIPARAALTPFGISSLASELLIPCEMSARSTDAYAKSSKGKMVRFFIELTALVEKHRTLGQTVQVNVLGKLFEFLVEIGLAEIQAKVQEIYIVQRWLIL